MENDLPCELDSVISLKFNFDNLQKLLDFLHIKNMKNQSKIEEVANRLVEFSVIKQDIKDIFLKIETMNKREDELNNTLVFHSNKLLDIEKINVGLENVRNPFILL
jgi:uncharacterized coiled-coil DUF342 family protein